MACWGIIIREDLLAMIVHGSCNLGASWRRQGEKNPSGKDCSGHCVAVHVFGSSLVC
jgi:hypothetical protein